ncbi:MAG: ATP-dependent sacrificial sulfur transferase LarE [Proteobacteria bacterium]|nr:ATP-dependent sacrificial sulfur transferase LarE [Pseudomonadota bacterium]
MTPALQEKYQRLVDQIQSFDSAIVAFSGGIDSSLVAYVTASLLGERSLAVTSGSPSLKRSDLNLSQRLADEWGMQHEVIVTDELSKAEYRANPVNRCFHCKTSLYQALNDMARARGFQHILNGTNIDDLGDHRPGLIAADDFKVVSPLVDAGFCKQDIRDLAAHLKLENANKPQAACLSSRFPYGSSIDEKLLAQVESAESVLDKAGFTQFRVRHHGDVARLEIGPDEFPRVLEMAGDLQRDIKACGYRFVSLDLGGFRSGSLNEGIQIIEVT